MGFRGYRRVRYREMGVETICKSDQNKGKGNAYITDKMETFHKSSKIGNKYLAYF